MELEYTASVGDKHEFNLMLSLRHLGLGFNVNIGDWINTAELKLLFLHITYLYIKDGPA